MIVPCVSHSPTHTGENDCQKDHTPFHDVFSLSIKTPDYLRWRAYCSEGAVRKVNTRIVVARFARQALDSRSRASIPVGITCSPSRITLPAREMWSRVELFGSVQLNCVWIPDHDLLTAETAHRQGYKVIISLYYMAAPCRSPHQPLSCRIDSKVCIEREIH